MSKAKLNFRWPLAVLLASAAGSVVVMPLMAADTTVPAVPAPRAESAQVMLIRRLAERGAITQEDAAEMIKLAEADAADARVQAALAALATAQADAARAHSEAAAIQTAASRNTLAKSVSEIPVASVPTSPAPVQVVETPVPVPSAPTKTIDAAMDTAAFVPPAVTKSTATAKTAAADEDDSVRVTYVPEVVKAQLREEIKNEVMEQAKQEHWAAPRSFPDWVSRFTFYGDFRLRYEGVYNHQQNEAISTSTNFINFNAINSGAPFDVGTGGSNLVSLPRYNLDQDRARFRVRARLGVAIDLGEGFTSGYRMATGESNSPVTQNQTLGAAGSGQGGSFSKYSVWLDRAYLKYQSDAELSRAIVVTLGRFENPFLSTSIIWADDLGFDGLAMTLPAQIHYDGVTADSVRPYFVIGAFPVFNTDLNFPSNKTGAKYPSSDKWLEAAQFGLDFKLGRDLKAKLGAGYYYFTNTAGKLSTEYTPLTASDSGDTDARRPAFAQKGNTYMALRNIAPDSTNSNGLTNQWQYFGLASQFRDIAVDLRLDYNHFEPFQVSFIAEYVKNMGFDRSKILARNPENNYGASAGSFLGGGNAWIAGLRLGDALLQKRWDWAINISYRNVESDAVIDGFCDSDFGGGGTNVKGLTLGANLALSKRVIVGAKWMGSTQVEGPTFKNDILQIDLNAKF